MKLRNRDLMKIMKMIKTKIKWGTIGFPTEDREDKQGIRRERAVTEGRPAAFGEDAK